MAEYQVKWECDIEASSPLEAALIAEGFQTAGTFRPAFLVRGPDKNEQLIDLEDDDLQVEL